jgi:hypothetical protein
MDTFEDRIHADQFTRSFLNDSPVEPLNQYETGVLGQLFLGYQLLDTLLWIHKWPFHPSLQPITRTFSTELPHKRLDKIRSKMNSLTAFPIAVNNFKRIQVDESSDILSKPPGLWESALMNLSRATQANRRSQRQQVLSNLFAAASVLAWFRPVSIMFLFITSQLIVFG